MEIRKILQSFHNQTNNYSCSFLYYFLPHPTIKAYRTTFVTVIYSCVSHCYFITLSLSLSLILFPCKLDQNNIKNLCDAVASWNLFIYLYFLFGVALKPMKENVSKEVPHVSARIIFFFFFLVYPFKPIFLFFFFFLKLLYYFYLFPIKDWVFGAWSVMLVVKNKQHYFT